MPNCLTFALRLWKYGRGDHLAVRKSRFGWFPHFAVMSEYDGTLVVREFRPINPITRRFPPLFFRGEVVTTTYKQVSQEKG